MTMTYDELYAKYGDKKVGVVPARYFENMNNWTNLTYDDMCSVNAIAFPNMQYVLRCSAELDESYRQLIGYVLLINRDLDFFVTQRKAGDSRLTGKLSLGVGGHIDDGESLYDSVMRELKEEMTGERYGEMNPIAFIVSNNTPVDRVHAGVVILSHPTDFESFGVRETDKLDGWWMSQWDIIKRYDEFESWSQLVIDNMINIGEMPE